MGSLTLVLVRTRAVVGQPLVGWWTNGYWHKLGKGNYGDLFFLVCPAVRNYSFSKTKEMYEYRGNVQARDCTTPTSL